MVYLEALASGCITICRKKDGIDGIIKDGFNGFLCEDNLEELFIKIFEISDKTTILRNAYATAQNFTAKKVAENYINYLVLYNT